MMRDINHSYKKLLKDKHILIFENDFLLNDETSNKLQSIIGTIIFTVNNRIDAIDHLEENDVDAVIIQTSISAEEAIPFIEILDEKNIPFLFAFPFVPHNQSNDFPGYVLNNDDVNLSYIAEALFMPHIKYH